MFEAATRPLRVWFANNQSLPREGAKPDAALLEEMDGLRYASSLRASVNRYGSWYNFDYWHCLGFGARRDTVARSVKQMTVLEGLIETALNDPQLSEVQDFLRHFQTQAESAFKKFYQDVQSLGENAYLEQLKADYDYWNNCTSRWGGGHGYISVIRRWTKDWFSTEPRVQRYEFIEREVQRLWRELIKQLDEQLAYGREEDAESAESEAAIPSPS